MDQSQHTLREELQGVNTKPKVSRKRSKPKLRARNQPQPPLSIREPQIRPISRQSNSSASSTQLKIDRPPLVPHSGVGPNQLSEKNSKDLSDVHHSFYAICARDMLKDDHKREKTEGRCKPKPLQNLGSNGIDKVRTGGLGKVANTQTQRRSSISYSQCVFNDNEPDVVFPSNQTRRAQSSRAVLQEYMKNPIDTLSDRPINRVARAAWDRGSTIDTVEKLIDRRVKESF